MSDRTCGSCNLCCKVVAAHEIAKPAGTWCPHARPGAGCAIYGAHPQACRKFNCAWLEIPELDDAWKPEACGFVIYSEDEGRGPCTDAARPDAWRAAPFHEALKAWAFDRLRRGGHAVVYVEDKVIALFPEEELDLCGHTGAYRRSGGRRPQCRI